MKHSCKRAFQKPEFESAVLMGFSNLKVQCSSCEQLTAGSILTKACSFFQKEQSQKLYFFMEETGIMWSLLNNQGGNSVVIITLTFQIRGFNF